MFGTTENDTIWFNKDFEGIVLSVFAQVVMFILFLCSQFLTIPEGIHNVALSWIMRFINIILYLLCSICHFRCVFTNPGAVPHNAQPLKGMIEESGELLNRCGICNAYKPPKSHHCRVCNRCILLMDHHCPWVNNCVGMCNMKYFILLLIYTILYSIQIFFCTANCSLRKMHFSRDVDVMIVMLLFGASAFFSIVFGVFCTVILSNIIQVAITGLTQIDVLRNVETRSVIPYENLSDIFGSNGHFHWTWLLPIAPTYPNFSKTAQYELDPTGKRWNGYENI